MQSYYHAQRERRNCLERKEKKKKAVRIGQETEFPLHHLFLVYLQALAVSVFMHHA